MSFSFLVSGVEMAPYKTEPLKTRSSQTLAIRHALLQTAALAHISRQTLADYWDNMLKVMHICLNHRTQYVHV